MRHSHQALLTGLGVVSCLLAPIPSDVSATSCPGGGAVLEVCVKNPTATQRSLTIAGDVIQDQVTCTGSSALAYSMPITLAPGGPTAPCQLYPVSGLATGMWVHRIYEGPEPLPPGMLQYQKGPVLVNGTGTPKTRVNWTYFPSVIWVNKIGDDSTNPDDCPVNALFYKTCTFRQALVKANQISGATNPVLIGFRCSPGAMTQSTFLTLGGQGYITVDAISEYGEPWIVGDANAPQDSFSHVVDLNDKTRFSITSSNNTIQGLWIKNTIPTPTPQQGKDLLVFAPTPPAQAQNNRVYAVKIDGGNRRACPLPAGCGGTLDIFVAAGGGSSFNEPAVTVSNVEAHSGLDKGVKANNGWAVIRDSWFHHNYRGNIQATLGGKVLAERNFVEKAGRRLLNGSPVPIYGATPTPDDLVVDDGAQGLVANDRNPTQTPGTPTPSRLETDGNISRLNTNNGLAVRASGNPRLVAKNDYTCGNRFAGVGVSDSGVATGQGIGAFYNADSGVKVDTSGVGASANFGNATPTPGQTPNPGNNAFAHNHTGAGTCEFRNPSTQPVNAQRNQWLGNTCSGKTCGGGVVHCNVARNYFSEAIALDSQIPTIPSNVILKGQTIRIRGSGFDAIRGNPAPAGACVEGETNPSQSCCLSKPQEGNVCGTGVHNPLSDKGNCVELCDSAGQWVKTTVTAVTPTTIVTSIPDDVFFCTGQDALVHVSKRGADGQQLIADMKAYCTNVAPKDQL